MILYCHTLVLWDARVVGERKLAEEGSLVFAAMSGSWFRSLKMSLRMQS